MIGGFQAQRVGAVGVLILLALTSCTAQQAAPPPPWTDLITSAPSNAGLRPERLQAYDRPHYWQLTASGDPPKGLVVLIHGCGRESRSFFPYDPVYCPECTGLPEHLAQTKQVLARGYAVLALQASDQGSRCWSSSTRNGKVDDRPLVAAAVAAFQANHSLTGQPLYFHGFSSGGTMALKLPGYLNDAANDGSAADGVAEMRIDGIVSVDAAPEGEFGAWNDDGELRLPYYPPTLFVVMEKGKSKQRAGPQIDTLRQNGVQADMIVSPERPITPTYFSVRMPNLSPQQSEALVAALRQVNLLDDQGYCTYSPFNGRWVGEAQALLPWLTTGWDGIVQEVWVAYAEHENLADWTTASLAWLETGGEEELEPLVEELVVSRLADLTVLEDTSIAPSDVPGALQVAAPAAAPAPAPAL